MFSDKKLSSRNAMLAVGVFAMLFSGILYAWSILKVPFKADFGFGDSSLAFNFTLTMCFFCIGAFLGSRLFRIIGTRWTIILAGLLVGIGFECYNCGFFVFKFLFENLNLIGIFSESFELVVVVLCNFLNQSCSCEEILKRVCFYEYFEV